MLTCLSTYVIHLRIIAYIYKLTCLSTYVTDLRIIAIYIYIVIILKSEVLNAVLILRHPAVQFGRSVLKLRKSLLSSYSG